MAGNNKPKILCVIGARSGSKSIPNKNIRSLAGKPMMAWVIEAAKKSKLIDRIILSTDSQEYAEIGRKYGAEAPFLRPADIAGDKALEKEYLIHAATYLQEEENFSADIVIRLQPTCPLQNADDIDKCLQKLIDDPSADSSMVVAEARQHPYKAMKIVDLPDGSQTLTSFLNGDTQSLTPSNRQGFEKVYFRSNIIATRAETLIKHKSQSGNKVAFHIIPQERSLDIDNEIDFIVAEAILSK